MHPANLELTELPGSWHIAVTPLENHYLANPRETVFHERKVERHGTSQNEDQEHDVRPRR